MAEKLKTKQETLFDLFYSSYINHKNNNAIIEDSGLERKRMTYEELFNASESIGQLLDSFTEDLKSKSQFISIYMEQNLVFPAVVLGILSRGFGFTVIDPSWSEEKQRDFVHKLQCPCLIRPSSLPSLWPENRCLALDVSGNKLIFEKVCIDTLQDIRQCPHLMAYAIQTSGSTGEPKTIRVPHASIVPNICDLRRELSLSSKDVVFLSSPPTFDPSVVDIFLAVSSGATLLITSKSVKASPSALLKVLFHPISDVQGVSILQMTPSVFSRWSDFDLRNSVFGSSSPLRVLLLGGEPCMFLPKLMNCKGAQNKTDVYTIYGITEVSAWASILRVESTSKYDDTNSKTSQDRGSSLDLGHALTDTILQVRDLNSELVLEEGIGEMCIGSHKRICEVDSENCRDFSSPLYRNTGDIVKVSNGCFLYIGRKDQVVKRWGQRVSLQSVECLAMDHDSVSLACCVWDERKHCLSLFVKTNKSLEKVSLQRHYVVASNGNDNLIPDEIYIVEDMPIDHHGKVNRHLLSVNASTKYSQTRRPMKQCSSLKPVSEFTKKWCSILGFYDLQLLNPNASFISSGGNSLLALLLEKHLVELFGSVPDDLVGHLLSEISFDSCLQKINNFYSSVNPKIEMESHYSAKGEICNPSPTFETSEGALKTNPVLVSSNSPGKTSDGLCLISKSAINLRENLTVSLSWRANLDKCIDASPLCLHYECGTSYIIIGSHSGKFVAIDGSLGIIKWSLLLPNRIESSACVSSCGLHVYVGCYDGKLYSVSVVRGEILWHFQTDAMIKSTPTLCNDGRNILFGSYDHQIYCLDAQNGVLLWKSYVLNPTGCWFASPVVISNVAIVCSLAAQIAAVNTTTGATIWLKKTDSPIFATPVALPQSSESLVVVAEVCGKLQCFCSSTGKEIWCWSLESSSHIFSSLSCTIFEPGSRPAYLIMFGCHDSFVYCLHMSSQLEVSLYWKVPTCSPVRATPFPFICKSSSETAHVVAISSSGKVFILNLIDGSIEVEYVLPFEVFSSPVVQNLCIYVGCRDDHVYCLYLGCKEQRLKSH